MRESAQPRNWRPAKRKGRAAPHSRSPARTWRPHTSWGTMGSKAIFGVGGTDGPLLALAHPARAGGRHGEELVSAVLGVRTGLRSRSPRALLSTEYGPFGQPEASQRRSRTRRPACKSRSAIDQACRCGHSTSRVDKAVSRPSVGLCRRPVTFSRTPSPEAPGSACAACRFGPRARSARDWCPSRDCGC
jgi:hypothetical protein